MQLMHNAYIQNTYTTGKSPEPSVATGEFKICPLLVLFKFVGGNTGHWALVSRLLCMSSEFVHQLVVGRQIVNDCEFDCEFDSDTSDIGYIVMSSVKDKSKRKNERSIADFLVKRARPASESPVQPVFSLTNVDVDTEMENVEAASQPLPEPVSNPVVVSVREPGVNVEGSQFDIANAVGQKLTDQQKYDFLENTWQLGETTVLPYSEHIKLGVTEKRFFRHKPLRDFPFLAFSHIAKGVYCKLCVIFADECGLRSCQQFGKLAKSPLTTFAKITGKDGDITKHQRLDYHKFCAECAANFVHNFRKPLESINSRIDQERVRQVTENRKWFRPIVETIILCGRQNLALRGHRDDGAFYPDAQQSNDNQGNFREILKFRAKDNEHLRRHLEQTHKPHKKEFDLHEQNYSKRDH